MAGVDDVGMAGRQLTPRLGIAGLCDDGSALRRGRQIETPGNIEVLGLEGKVLALPDRSRRLDELLGALITFGKGQMIAPAEIRTGKGAGEVTTFQPARPFESVSSVASWRASA